MSRQLMPQSGVLAPYVVVNRDAAVAGVFSVDGERGAIDLTTKYLSITTFNTSMDGVNDSITSINTSIGNINTALSGKAGKGANNDITSLQGLTTAITIAQGGTGAKTASEARVNLNLDRIVQGSTYTDLTASNNSTYRIRIQDNGIWGATSSTAWVPLAIAQGGTGVTTQTELWSVIRPNGPTPLVADPVNNLDAATKRWVETLINNLNSVNTSWSVVTSDATRPVDNTVIYGGSITSEYRIGNNLEAKALFVARTQIGGVYSARIQIANSTTGRTGTIDLREDGQIVTGGDISPGTLLTDSRVGLGSKGGAVPPNDANLINENGIFAGPGVTGINWGNQYAALLNMSRYSGGSSTAQLQIDPSGTLRVRGGNGTVWQPWLVMQAQGTSGREFKRDITPADPADALNRITAQDLVTFIYKDDEQERVRFGIIAEDSELVTPQYVKHDEETIEIDGEVITRDHPRIDINPIVMDLMGAVQALTKRVQELEELLASK